MTIKNGDKPINPICGSTERSVDKYDHSKGYFNANGLTKREHFAVTAPDMPKWFVKLNPIDSSILTGDFTEQQYKDAQEVRNENYGYERFDEGNKALSLISAYEQSVLDSHEVAIYFKWRTFYADNLLKALEQ